MKILILEDNPDDAEMVLRHMRKCFPEFESERVETKEDFIRAIRKFKPDLILADYELPSYNAGEALEDAKRACPGTPFIVVTGTVSEEVAVDLMKNGADDYVLKDKLARLCPAVRNALGSRETSREKEISQDNLSRSEERFKVLFDEAPLPYQSLDESGNFLYVNQTWFETLGYEREEVIGKNFAEFLAGDLGQLFKERFKDFKRDGQICDVQFEMLKKDGSTITTEFTGSIAYDDQGNFKQTHSIFQDITERKKAEKEAEKARIYLDSIIDMSPFPMWVSDREGTMVRTNRSLRDALNVTDEELIGKYNVFNDDNI
ncbi:MAG: PAS domain S-box protein, partial [Candidatus Tantalella remota]|nr:PAS domain S-box protein [Candidatus Tantalella remota]